VSVLLPVLPSGESVCNDGSQFNVSCIVCSGCLIGLEENY
jgi:hypothetical protein